MFTGIGRPAENGALWTVISKRPPLEDFRVYSYETMTLEPLYSLHSFASLFARVHGPVFTLSFAPSRAQNLPWRTFPPSPTGACCDETPVGGEVKHVLDPESDQNSGIEESHIQLLSRHVFGKEKMYEVLIVCQVIVVGKRLNCAMECDWNMVLFYFFKREGLSKHHKPADWIHGKATMQRVNRYTCFLLLYRGQRLRSGSRDCRKSREIRPRGGQTFHFSRPQATGLSEKGVVAHSFHGCFNVNRHCRMLTHQLWTANLHKLSPRSCWSVASWRYVNDFRACSTLI